MSSLGTKISKGAVWMVLFKLAERSLGIISTIILARLLIPEDFGLIAMAMSIIAILELMGAFGFDMALIQNQKATRHQYDTAWTFNVLFALLSALLLLLLAYPATLFYEEPRLHTVIYFLAFGTFISGFENIGVVAFRKDLEFNKEFRFLIGKKLMSFMVTVPLAFILQNYWALVFGILAGKVGSVLLSYYVHSYRPRFDLSSRHELFHFSKWILINNILLFFRLHSADFIIGRVAGPHPLGLYTVAFEISNLPTTELIAPINRAVYPGYAKISDDAKSLGQVFLTVIAIIALFALPAGIGIAVTSDLLVKVVLGKKWVEAVPIIQILALYGVFTALQTNTMYIYIAIGRPHITALISTVYLVLLFPLLIWLTFNNGAIGAAWSYLIASVILLPVNFLVIFYLLKLKLVDFISFVWRPVVSGLIMYESVSILLTTLRYYWPWLPDIIALVVAIAFGAITYTFFIILFWNISGQPIGAEKSILEKLYPRLSRGLQIKYLNPDS